MPSDLHHELYEYLINHLHDTPRDWRPRPCWVMSQEWYDEIKAMAAAVDTPVPEPTLLFGLPFLVREGAGVPHLITD